MMWRFFAIVLTLFCANVSLAQETYFYKLSSIVSNGQKRKPGTASHIFVTFSKDICYDSDKDGFYGGYGKLRRVAENGQSVKYSGYCFFGSAEYVVSKSKDLINIWSADGNMYIYTRDYPVSTVTKSSYGNLVCQYDTNVNHVPETPITSGINNSGVVIIDNSGKEHNTRPIKELTCPICHGNGKCSSCAGRGWKKTEGYYGGGIHDCGICNGTGRCNSCYGKGTIRN